MLTGLGYLILFLFFSLKDLMCRKKLLSTAVTTFLFVVICSHIFGQIPESMLCQGAHFTEKQAKKLHAKWARSFNTVEEWDARAKVIRNGILVGAELSEFPPRTALRPIIHSKREMDGYTVENVAFESLPGLFVTGNLYKPTGKEGPFPGIVSPHGHWSSAEDYGRFRKDKQLLCASLAKMGAIVFAYDMIGYGESDQTIHKHPKGIKIQSWNGKRAIDFLETLPEIDRNRIAVTGASGGATQGFLLTALDSRIAVSVHVVQVSAHFFGGCTCESGMPIHKSLYHQTSNVEIAALAAPKPMLIVSDGDDWTSNTPKVEFPYIKRIYDMYGAGDLVENAHFADERHDYGPSKRKAAYRFLAKHLKLYMGGITDINGNITEEGIPLLSRDELQVFNDAHPRPSYAVMGDEAVTKLLEKTRFATKEDLFPPTPVPDRIVLSLQADPAHSLAVNWRTDTSVTFGIGELALADASPDFVRNSESFAAQTTRLKTDMSTANYHSITFSNLQPHTQYVYRVGTDEAWSEWFHVTTAEEGVADFSFIYFGDAQNDLKSMWSRTIRSAFSTLPEADFMLHAGDLVNRSLRDQEWGEWFYSGGWIYGMIPSMATPGNHEYNRIADDEPRVLSAHWKPTFSLPENGPKGLEETAYYIDYQGVRFISLNTQEIMQNDAMARVQAEWLETILTDNPNSWTIVTHHHPIYSLSTGRNNVEFRELFQPIYEAKGVDLVLQGHDHAYGRGRNIKEGTQVAQTGGPVYVVSVSGPKMYQLAPAPWMEWVANNTQLYQTVAMKGDSLQYRAYTTTGELYDAFSIVKQADDSKQFVDQKPAHVSVRDKLPVRIDNKLNEAQREVYFERFKRFKETQKNTSDSGE